MESMSLETLHLAALPWFAAGHITPFLQLSNRFAERGCRVSFFIPTNTQTKFNHLNLYPNLIHFIPLTVPQVEGLPSGTETMSDVPVHYFYLLAKAFDLTQHQVQEAIHNLQPHAILMDFSHWLPIFAHSLRIKCIFFPMASTAVISSVFLPLPSQMVVETLDLGDEVSFYYKVATTIRECDAICLRGCNELDGQFCDKLKNGLNKPVMLIGTNLPEASNAPLEERWGKWLGGFEKGSVIYCAFGSECVLKKDEFQEVVLGLELTGLPFLARLKPPLGVETVEEALPDGFKERVRGRGIVHEGWVQQHQILSHPSVGCFVSHCGFSSMLESLASSCQIVLIPQIADQFINTKFLTEELKVAVEVERREEDRWFTRDNVLKAVKLVTDEASEVGKQVRANHHRLKELLSTEGLDSAYLDNCIIKLQELIFK